jgi:hypothetical protein
VINDMMCCQLVIIAELLVCYHGTLAAAPESMKDTRRFPLEIIFDRVGQAAVPGAWAWEYATSPAAAYTV